MPNNHLKGLRQINGTKKDFNIASLENGYINFVRTSNEKDEGYIYLNGKQYGNIKKNIDCGKI